jgi:hypothetical protein
VYFLNELISAGDSIYDMEHAIFNSYLMKGIVYSSLVSREKPAVPSVLRFVRIRNLLFMTLTIAACCVMRIKKGYRTLEPLFYKPYRKLYLIAKVNFAKYKDGSLLIS